MTTRDPRNADRYRRLLRAALLLAVLAALVLAAVLLAVKVKGSSQLTRRWFGHVAAAAVVTALALGIGLLRRMAIRTATEGKATPIPGILVGKDNRISTSKISALAWTLALGWAITSLLIADWAGAPGGWHKLAAEGIKDEYLVLLGGPFVALIGAAAIVRAKLAAGTLTKAPAPGPPSVAQAFTDDAGQTDLVDSQYLFFGAIALIAFVVQFIREAGDGLPQLPTFLVALASAGTTAYVVNKAAGTDEPPSLVRVSPDRAAVGTPVTVVGRNLLPHPQDGLGTAAPGTTVTVIFGSAEVPVDVAKLEPGTVGYDRIEVLVPPLPTGETAPSDVDVGFENVLGVPADKTVPFKILA